jgi:hypothetical protein
MKLTCKSRLRNVWNEFFRFYDKLQSTFRYKYFTLKLINIKLKLSEWIIILSYDTKNAEASFFFVIRKQSWIHFEYFMVDSYDSFDFNVSFNIMLKSLTSKQNIEFSVIISFASTKSMSLSVESLLFGGWF